MLAERFCGAISDDWLWRERELRDLDASLLKGKTNIEIKSAILISYSHWEGHFKNSATELLTFMHEGIKRKLFKWTDIRSEIRTRILFCSFRRSSISGQTHETFISYLNALNDSRYADALDAKNEIIMTDDNLNTMRAEAICRNLGVDSSWFSLKRIIIDERILAYRNAIAHGSRRLRTGDEMELSGKDILDSLSEIRGLIRETRNRFENAITDRRFL